MPPPVRDNFRYLNREGSWLDFRWSGLELTPDGGLQLLPAPRLTGPAPAPAPAAALPDAPSGLAVDCRGRVFASLPDQDRVQASGDCDPNTVPLTCLSESAGLGSLAGPRGLLLLSHPERLVVADSGNHRLLFCDTVARTVRETWGGAVPGADLAPSHAADGFDTPWSVAAESDGRTLYVLDAGNRRILKLARTRDPDPSFTTQTQASGLVPHPGALAVSGQGPHARIFVADLDTDAIAVFDAAGAPVPAADGRPARIAWPGMGGILAMATGRAALYVGDTRGQRILSFALTEGFPFCGAAADFRGTVTALAVTPQGDRLLAAIAAGQVCSFDPAGARLDRGVLWSGPIAAGPSAVSWQRLTATVSSPPASHIAFHYALGDGSHGPPVDPTAPDPFADPGWHPLAADTTDFLLTDGRSPHLFVGAMFSGDRAGTPKLTQIRADFDTDSFTRYLPAIYRNPAAPDRFLERFVRLLQGVFEDIEAEAGSLDRYFDPFAVPADALPWLATWLAVDLDQGEAESRIRRSIAGAFRRTRWRGTVEGLRLALLEDAGVHAVIEEPIAAASFWGGRGAGLGMGTSLPSAQPGGAVLGSTAKLDHAYLMTDDRFGEPLFEEAAWQCVVRLYRHEVGTAARLQQVRDVIEREKPAHAMYRLELIDPWMRVGAQARVGIDAIVAGDAGPTPLGCAAGISLAGTPPARIGTCKLGSDLKL